MTFSLLRFFLSFCPPIRSLCRLPDTLYPTFQKIIIMGSDTTILMIIVILNTQRRLFHPHPHRYSWWWYTNGISDYPLTPFLSTDSCDDGYSGCPKWNVRMYLMIIIHFGILFVILYLLLLSYLILWYNLILVMMVHQGDFGDVSERLELRKNLKCHSFGWYIKNIYPQLFVPGEAVASGEVRNLGGPEGQNKMCLDSAAHKSDLHKPVGLYPCHNQGGNQYWLLSKEGEIRRDEACLDFSGKDVILYPCHGSRGNQLWIYDPESKQVKHGSSGKCLEMSPSREKLWMRSCDPLNHHHNDNENIINPNQQWSFENFDQHKFTPLVWFTLFIIS